MKILFSPSEGKKHGGVTSPIQENSFLFPELYGKRKEVIARYQNFVDTATDEQLTKLFGIKDNTKFGPYLGNIYSQPTMKAIERYDGVAFDYLDYGSLTDSAKEYVDHNTIIFSNLFGPIKAGDEQLPEYKLKQGEKIDGFAPEVFYKKHFTEVLDRLLADEPFLDLRAGFYNKFYKPSSPYVTLKFIKNGKVVSHWAKAYRGIVLRNLALNDVQEMDEFIKMKIENLAVHEILHKGIHTEVVYDILA